MLIPPVLGLARAGAAGNCLNRNYIIVFVKTKRSTVVFSADAKEFSRIGMICLFFAQNQQLKRKTGLRTARVGCNEP
ncbi:hypothetical protein X474_02760 [Dethiosulfatarculus sandiegensis]|uniref:Uncharacterized protein n=1 Tax=Dethiosulfatarculus sandiegensis TaxID=1429043 RepID=A0A0D2JC56_9BACT|nr:hypothetical protein X474_02760 [Dethiosulfatarculus sandiegensis]